MYTCRVRNVFLLGRIISGSNTNPYAEKVTQPVKCGTFTASGNKSNFPFRARTFKQRSAVSIVLSTLSIKQGCRLKSS